MEHISAPPTIVDIAECHHALFARDKLWLISRKGFEQPTFSYYHRIAFAGGYVINFDVNTNKWSSPITFDRIDEGENLDELLFVVQSHILMLIYARFNGVHFKSLHQWNFESNRWNKIATFEVSASANAETPSGRSEVVLMPSNDVNAVHFAISDSYGHVYVNRLTIVNDDDIIKSAIISRVLDVDENIKPFHARMGHVVSGVAYKHSFALIGGMHGCGFRWQPNRCTVIDVDTKVGRIDELDTPLPPFGYSGSRTNALLADGRWLHISGDRAYGMTGMEFDGEIWSIDMKQPLAWHRASAIVLPTLDKMTIVIAVDTQRNVIYAGDMTVGLFKTIV